MIPFGYYSSGKTAPSSSSVVPLTRKKMFNQINSHLHKLLQRSSVNAYMEVFSLCRAIDQPIIFIISTYVILLNLKKGLHRQPNCVMLS